MSLMNEALRKKNRETTGSPAPTGFIDVSQRPRISRQYLVGLAAMILLTAAAFYGTHLVQTSTAPPLLVKSPSPGHTRPPAQRSSLSASDAHDQSDTMPLPASVRHQTEAFTSEEPPTGDRMAAAGLEPASPSLAESRNVPGTHDGMSASKLPSADAQPVFPLVTTVSGSDETPVQSTPRETDAVSRAVEPGPLQKPNTGGKTRSLTPRHPPSPAQLAPPTAPVASKPTGGRNTDAAVRKTVPSDGDDDLFYKKARSYHRSGRLDDAIRLLPPGSQIEANHPGAMLNLAAATMQRGNYVCGPPPSQTIGTISATATGVLLNLAIAAIGMGDPEQALAIWTGQLRHRMHRPGRSVFTGPWLCPHEPTARSPGPVPGSRNRTARRSPPSV
jgi:hypothetical protein